jgi:hypothetical protein
LSPALPLGRVGDALIGGRIAVAAAFTGATSLLAFTPWPHPFHSCGFAGPTRRTNRPSRLIVAVLSNIPEFLANRTRIVPHGILLN